MNIRDLNPEIVLKFLSTPSAPSTVYPPWYCINNFEFTELKSESLIFRDWFLEIYYTRLMKGEFKGIEMIQPTL